MVGKQRDNFIDFNNKIPVKSYAYKFKEETTLSEILYALPVIEY